MSTPTESLVGVAAALASLPPTRSALSQFSLLNQVAIVTGGHRGIGLEMALALAEAGAVVYCLDLPAQPDSDWLKVQSYAAKLPSLDVGDADKKGRLEYVSGDVTDQQEMWKIAERIAQKEGRIDICVANAGILRGFECLEYPAEEFRKLLDVNINGVLFSAQAAGRQMERLGIKGSIVLIASMSGTIANKDQHWVAYNTSKAAVLQMARSMACELGVKGIRVNSISPGYIYTQMTRNFLDTKPHLMAEWSSHNPLGRLGMPDELRGVVLWLASAASTFCTGSDIIVDGGHRAW
ncbi:D-arabinitol 2-dehydrogenase [ribulose-forming] [Hypsizygus marmoreus]|uniref:D-arabinitol 2-dehydrogenase [ribulose-forming] n=1 Tax=Hypsizygus marmoreus TaxID=39966 RepID=A0A369KBH4_HYPMA|nr:D-arabinitol 2-dehydrogenase [ribulose-forming] [Hypsizygus marmoreus]